MSRPAARIMKPAVEELSKLMKHYIQQGYSKKEAFATARAMLTGKSIPVRSVPRPKHIEEIPETISMSIEDTRRYMKGLPQKKKGLEGIGQFLEEHPRVEKYLPWAVAGGVGGAAWGAKEAFGEEAGTELPTWNEIVNSEDYIKAPPEKQKRKQIDYLKNAIKDMQTKGESPENIDKIARIISQNIRKPIEKFTSAEELLSREVKRQFPGKSLMGKPLPETVAEVGPTAIKPTTKYDMGDYFTLAKRGGSELLSDLGMAGINVAKGVTYPVGSLELREKPFGKWTDLMERYTGISDVPYESERRSLMEYLNSVDKAIDDYRIKKGFKKEPVGTIPLKVPLLFPEGIKVGPKGVSKIAGELYAFGGIHKAVKQIINSPRINKATAALANVIGHKKATRMRSMVQYALEMAGFSLGSESEPVEKTAMVTVGGLLGFGPFGGKAIREARKVTRDVGTVLGRSFPGELLPSGITAEEVAGRAFETGKMFSSGYYAPEIVASSLNNLFAKHRLPTPPGQEHVEKILKYNLENNPLLNKIPAVSETLKAGEEIAFKPKEVAVNLNNPLTAYIRDRGGTTKAIPLEGQPWDKVAENLRTFLTKEGAVFERLEGDPAMISKFQKAMSNPELFRQSQALMGWESHVNFVNKASKAAGLGPLTKSELGYRVGVLLQGQGKLPMVSSADPRVIPLFQAAVKVQPGLRMTKFGNTAVLYRGTDIARAYMANKDWLTRWGAGVPDLERLIAQAPTIPNNQQKQFMTFLDASAEVAIEKAYREGLQDVYKGMHTMGEILTHPRKMPVAPTSNFTSNRGIMDIPTIGGSGGQQAEALAKSWSINERLLEDAMMKIEGAEKAFKDGVTFQNIRKLAAEKGAEVTASRGSYMVTQGDKGFIVGSMKELAEKVKVLDLTDVPESPVINSLIQSAKAEKIPPQEFNRELKILGNTLAEWARKVEEAQKAEPLINRLPKLSLKPWDPGLPSFVHSYFRPPKYAFQEYGKAFNMPELYRAWENVNEGQRAARRFVLPHAKRLNSIFKGVPNSRMEDWTIYMETPAKKKASKALELNLKPWEMKKLEQLRVWFDDLYRDFGISAPYVEQYMTRMRELGEKAFRGKITDVNEKMAADFVRIGLLSNKEMNALRICEGYLNRNAKTKFVSKPLNEAIELLNKRETRVINKAGEITTEQGGYLLPQEVRTILDSYLRSVMGIDDELAFIMRRSITDTFGSLGIPGAEKLSKDVLDIFFTMNYGAFMAGRPKLIIRNLTQPLMTTLPYLETNFFARGYREALTPRGWNFARNAGIFTEMPVIRGEEIMAAGQRMAVTRGISKVVKGGLWGYRKADSMNRAVSYIGGYRQAEHYANLFNRGRISEKKLIDKTLDWFSPDVRDRALTYLREDTHKFADYVGNHIVEDSQWIYRAGGQPRVFQSSLGRLFGQYGTWPIYHNDQIYRMLKYPSFKNKVKWFAKKYAVQGALWTALYKNFGVSTDNWVYWHPMGFSGGPWGELMLDAWDASMGWGAEKQLARANLKYSLGGTKMLVPGMYLYKDISKALEEATPMRSAVRFTLGPIKNEEGFFIRDSIGGFEKDEIPIFE